MRFYRKANPEKDWLFFCCFGEISLRGKTPYTAMLLAGTQISHGILPVLPYHLIQQHGGGYRNIKRSYRT
jgi:hypothetical protein